MELKVSGSVKVPLMEVRMAPRLRISKDMVDLAAHLLDTKTSKFTPDKFKDKYETALKALVKRKAAGKTIEVPEAKDEESNVIDLMDALKQSLGRRKPAKATRVTKRSKARGRKRKAA
jgi:DNA end-binding protein Ku